MSSDLETSGSSLYHEEKILECPVVQCSLFTRIWWFRGISYVYSVHPPIVVEPHLPSVQSDVMTLFACYGQGLVSVTLLHSQSKATLGSWFGQTRFLLSGNARTVVTLNC